MHQDVLARRQCFNPWIFPWIRLSARWNLGKLQTEAWRITFKTIPWNSLKSCRNPENHLLLTRSKTMQKCKSARTSASFYLTMESLTLHTCSDLILLWFYRCEGRKTAAACLSNSTARARLRSSGLMDYSLSPSASGLFSPWNMMLSHQKLWFTLIVCYRLVSKRW